MAYLYLLQCKTGEYYTGITTDVARRMAAHSGRRAGGAKYTRAHPPAVLAAVWKTETYAAAARAEYRLKRLRHAQKAVLAAAPHRLGGADFPLPDGLCCRPLTEAEITALLAAGSAPPRGNT